MKLPPDKRNKLIMVAVATVAVLALLWYFLVGAQEAKIREINDQYQGELDKKKKIKFAVSDAANIESDLKAAQQKLTAAEEGMASGDLYSWLYTTIKNFKSSYQVDIPQFSTVEKGNTTLLCGFPYQQVKITVNGSAYFHDFGKFVADFENHFPHFRVENLSLEPTAGAEREADREKLNFKMDIIALVNQSPDAEKK